MSETSRLPLRHHEDLREAWASMELLIQECAGVVVRVNDLGLMMSKGLASEADAARHKELTRLAQELQRHMRKAEKLLV